MSNETCIFTTKDFTILEVMRDRCLGSDDPLAPILKRKIESALVVFRDDVPVNVATLSSRVRFSVDGRDADTRILSHDRMNGSAGLFLPITTPRALALLGLTEGHDFRLTDQEGRSEQVVAPKSAVSAGSSTTRKRSFGQPLRSAQRKPSLKLIRGAIQDQPRLERIGPDGFDDPGPSAA